MARGSQPGEHRGGRTKGTPNKATADIKALAQEHGPAAITKLVKLLGSSDERVQVQAVKELLDRGYGRSAQPLTGEGGEGPVAFEDVTLSDAELAHRIGAILGPAAASGIATACNGEAGDVDTADRPANGSAGEQG